MVKNLYIFGSKDLEQVESEQVVRWTGDQFAYAYTNGHRCYSGNAYWSDSVRWPSPNCKPLNLSTLDPP